MKYYIVAAIVAIIVALWYFIESKYCEPKEEETEERE